MDTVALGNRLRRELDQRTRLLKEGGDLASQLNVHLIGVSRGDIEHLERVHTLLYKEFEDQGIEVYRRALRQLEGNEKELSAIVSAVDSVLRDWCQSLIDHAQQCVETVARFSSNPPSFDETSGKFSHTVSALLDDLRADAEEWFVKGESMKPQDPPPQRTSPPIPSWFPKAGFASAAVAFFFIITLVIMETLGKQVPSTARILVDLAVAIAIACAFAFIGGAAKAEGKIPILKGYEPIRFATEGGIAVFVIVLGLCVAVYR